MKTILRLAVLGVFVIAGFIFIKGHWKEGKSKLIQYGRGGLNAVERNYGAEADQVATDFDLPANYLKALIALESSGRKPVPSRFEKHVFQRLKKARDGSKKSYEGIDQKDLKNASDEALKNLASSWGPFQLMGYQCLQLGITVADVRGDDAIYWGAKWINEEYGKKLRQGKFEQAFRIHNTGSPTGRTHDPSYASKGLRYMDHFK